jgi:branched-chain amino acid transport system ATP-binding protein
MLDEPVAGMNREETEDMARFILEVRRDWGITVLMVEHDMGMVMDLSDHVVVLNFGQVIAQGHAAPGAGRPRSGSRLPRRGRPGAAAREAAPAAPGATASLA